MNKKGFTLMELLLVVAVLAIVAAAAAPTFFGGAQEALTEAKKSNMNAAYQNTLTGANIMLGIAASKGNNLSGNLDTAQTSFDSKKLSDYSPATSRMFKGKNSSYIFSAKMVENTVVVTYATVADDADEAAAQTAAAGADTEIGGANMSATDVAKELDTAWTTTFYPNN